MIAPVQTRCPDDRITLYEVGPQDGLQNESTLVPVEAKVVFARSSRRRW